MTVEELITSLSGWNGDLEVMSINDYGDPSGVYEVEYKCDKGEYILLC